MPKAFLTLVTVGLLATAGMTACTQGGNAGTQSSGRVGGSGGKVGVILPDTTSSPRWENYDPRYLQLAFDAAKVPVDIENAQGSTTRFAQLADKMIAEGAKILMIANLDSRSGAAVLAKARAAKVKTIDYDRLTLGGRADYHVSFDNVQAGVLLGNGLVDCLTAKQVKRPVVAELNGSPTDNNATMFKQGYDSILQPRYDSAAYVKGPDQAVPNWDNAEGGAIFQQMLEQQPKIGGVLAANDGLAAAAIDVLKKHGLNGKVPVTGQDASLAGLRNILTGDQCLTIYRAVRPEAQAAANLAVALYRGWKPTLENLDLPKDTKLTQLKDPESGFYIPFLSLAPQLITLTNMQTVINDSFVTAQDLCGQEPWTHLCRMNGVGGIH